MSRIKDERMARYLAGEMSTSEEIAFMEEVQSNPKQHIELKNMEKSWRYYDENPSRNRWNSSSGWEKLHSKLETDGLLENIESERASNRLLPLLRIAASILLVLAIGIPSLYFGVIRNSDGETIKRHYSETGISTVDLPDGSRIFLNEGAEITYPAVFKQERAVELKGEAFFEVMSDPVNPFTVRSGKVMISVLGTSFNVKSKAQTSDIEVYVKTGKVRMALEESDRFITLQAEEVGLTENAELNRILQEDPNYISWKTKDFKFVDVELVEVLKELEASYHVNIHAQGVELTGMKITTSYREQSIDAILETIGTAFGMTVSNREDGYYLTN
jgi:ferric-dicitrate binding protein FerR (iron transport regulator)